MKKTFIFVMMIVVIVCLCACDNDTTNAYKSIDDLLQSSYSQVKLTISTTTDNDTLTSTFSSVQTDDKTTVSYTVQQFSTFGTTLPDSYITTKEGSIVVQNNKIVEQNGDQVDIDLTTLTATKISFQSSYLSDTQWNSNVLSANVTNAKAFMGSSSFDGTNVTVSVKVSAALEYLEISYTTSSNTQVVMHYEFTK